MPANLGVIELVDEYWTECGAHSSHMTPMAYAGDSLWHCIRATCRAGASASGDESAQLYRTAEGTLEELWQHGVVHGDEVESNLVWSTELHRGMATDLGRAILGEQEPGSAALAGKGRK